jgi:serine/threonine protein kinase
MPAQKALLKHGGASISVICAKVLGAMNYAHGKGWAHLDIRPSNIIVTENSEVLLIDWGCAAKLAEPIVGFRGCLPFAHDELLCICTLSQSRRFIS